MTATRELSTLVTDETRLVRAWVNFNGGGTVAIRASYNVSSITDNGVGDYTLNFTAGMADTNYAIVTGGSQAGSTSNSDRYASSYAVSTTQARLIFSAWINGNSKFDPHTASAAVFR